MEVLTSPLQGYKGDKIPKGRILCLLNSKYTDSNSDSYVDIDKLVTELLNESNRSCGKGRKANKTSNCLYVNRLRVGVVGVDAKSKGKEAVMLLCVYICVCVCVCVSAYVWVRVVAF